MASRLPRRRLLILALAAAAGVWFFFGQQNRLHLPVIILQTE